MSDDLAIVFGIAGPLNVALSVCPPRWRGVDEVQRIAGIIMATASMIHFMWR